MWKSSNGRCNGFTSSQCLDDFSSTRRVVFSRHVEGGERWECFVEIAGYLRSGIDPLKYDLGVNIAEALSAERADLEVAEWLLARFWPDGSDALPTVIRNAAQVDDFLSQVMMDGVETALDNAGDRRNDIIGAFRAVGLTTHADLILAVSEGTVTDDEAFPQFMASAGDVERINHEYIRSHLSVFQQFDKP